MSEFLNM